MIQCRCNMCGAKKANRNFGGRRIYFDANCPPSDRNPDAYEKHQSHKAVRRHAKKLIRAQLEDMN